MAQRGKCSIRNSGCEQLIENIVIHYSAKTFQSDDDVSFIDFQFPLDLLLIVHQLQCCFSHKFQGQFCFFLVHVFCYLSINFNTTIMLYDDSVI